MRVGVGQVRSFSEVACLSNPQPRGCCVDLTVFDEHPGQRDRRVDLQQLAEGTDPGSVRLARRPIRLSKLLPCRTHVRTIEGGSDIEPKQERASGVYKR